MESIVKAILNSDIVSLKKLLDDQVPKQPLCYSKFTLDFQLDDVKKVYVHEESTNSSNIDFENQRQEFLKLLLDIGAADISKTGLEFLVFVCKFVNQEIVKTIFNFGADFVSKDKWSLIKLLGALKSGKEEIYNLLLDRVDAATINRLALLHLYVKSGNASEEIVSKFIQLDADLNCLDEKVFDIAMNVGKLNVIEVLIGSKAEASEITLNDGDGLKVMKLAMSSGNLKVMEFLLEQGATTCQTFRCLFLDVIKEDNPEMLQLFLKYGAFSFQRNNDMSFVTVHAVQRGNEKMVKLMLDEKELLDEELLTSLLFEAIKCHNPAVVKLLLDRGADANSFDKSRDTALVRAMNYRQKEILKLLFDYGADVSNEGNSCKNRFLLHWAIDWQDKEIIELLLSQGFSIHLTNLMRETALMYALKTRAKKQIVQLLLDLGADTETKHHFCGTVLMYALYFIASKDHVQLLLDYGADVNEEHLERNALTISIEKENNEVSRILVKQIALMESQKIFVSEMNSNAVKGNNELDKFKKKCTTEIKSLKGKQFADSFYYYFDILKIQDIRKLSPLANSRSIVQTVKSIEFKKKFPIYGQIIVERIDRGISVNRDFELLKKFINYLSARNHDKLPKLPITCVTELFGYLKYADIVKLKYLNKMS